MTRNVKALETIINAAVHRDALCEGGLGKVGRQGEGGKTPPGPCEDGRPTGVLRALAIPNLRAWKGCYDAIGKDKNLFVPCWPDELEAKVGDSSRGRCWLV